MAYGMQPITVTASTMTLTKGHAGTVILMDRAAGIAFTLPAPKAGLAFTFFVKTAPTTAYTIATSGGSDIIAAGFNENEVDTGDDGPYLADGDLVSFVANIAAVGDFMTITSDGTKWYGYGQTNLDGGVTIAKT